MTKYARFTVDYGKKIKQTVDNVNAATPTGVPSKTNPAAGFAGYIAPFQITSITNGSITGTHLNSGGENVPLISRLRTPEVGEIAYAVFRGQWELLLRKNTTEPPKNYNVLWGTVLFGNYIWATKDNDDTEKEYQQLHVYTHDSVYYLYTDLVPYNITASVTILSRFYWILSMTINNVARQLLFKIKTAESEGGTFNNHGRFPELYDPDSSEPDPETKQETDPSRMHYEIAFRKCFEKNLIAGIKFFRLNGTTKVYDGWKLNEFRFTVADEKEIYFYSLYGSTVANLPTTSLLEGIEGASTQKIVPIDGKYYYHKNCIFYDTDDCETAIYPYTLGITKDDEPVNIYQLPVNTAKDGLEMEHLRHPLTNALISWGEKNFGVAANITKTSSSGSISLTPQPNNFMRYQEFLSDEIKTLSFPNRTMEMRELPIFTPVCVGGVELIEDEYGFTTTNLLTAITRTHAYVDGTLQETLEPNTIPTNVKKCYVSPDGLYFWTTLTDQGNLEFWDIPAAYTIKTATNSYVDDEGYTVTEYIPDEFDVNIFVKYTFLKSSPATNFFNYGGTWVYSVIVGKVLYVFDGTIDGQDFNFRLRTYCDVARTKELGDSRSTSENTTYSYGNGYIREEFRISHPYNGIKSSYNFTKIIENAIDSFVGEVSLTATATNITSATGLIIYEAIAQTGLEINNEVPQTTTTITGSITCQYEFSRHFLCIYGLIQINVYSYTFTAWQDSQTHNALAYTSCIISSNFDGDKPTDLQSKAISFWSDVIPNNGNSNGYDPPTGNVDNMIKAIAATHAIYTDPITSSSITPFQLISVTDNVNKHFIIHKQDLLYNDKSVKSRNVVVKFNGTNIIPDDFNHMANYTTNIQSPYIVNYDYYYTLSYTALNGQAKTAVFKNENKVCEFPLTTQEVNGVTKTLALGAFVRDRTAGTCYMICNCNVTFASGKTITVQQERINLSGGVIEYSNRIDEIYSENGAYWKSRWQMNNTSGTNTHNYYVPVRNAEYYIHNTLRDKNGLNPPQVKIYPNKCKKYNIVNFEGYSSTMLFDAEHLENYVYVWTARKFLIDTETETLKSKYVCYVVNAADFEGFAEYDDDLENQIIGITNATSGIANVNGAVIMAATDEKLNLLPITQNVFIWNGESFVPMCENIDEITNETTTITIASSKYDGRYMAVNLRNATTSVNLWVIIYCDENMNVYTLKKRIGTTSAIPLYKYSLKLAKLDEPFLTSTIPTDFDTDLTTHAVFNGEDIKYTSQYKIRKRTIKYEYKNGNPDEETITWEKVPAYYKSELKVTVTETATLKTTTTIETRSKNSLYYVATSGTYTNSTTFPPPPDSAANAIIAQIINTKDYTEFNIQTETPKPIELIEIERP